MPVRILVVDDFAPARRFITTSLSQKADYQVVGEASDGVAAVQKAEELQPDLVLLDLGLPKLNGIEAAGRIRMLAPQAKLLFVSQHSSSAVVREIFRASGQAYVYKMRAQDDLLPAIEAVLAGKRYVGAGVETSGDADDHLGHAAQFCSDDTVLIESLAWFIASALKDGGAGISLVGESRIERLDRKLKAEGLDIDEAVRQGTYVPLNDTETRPAVMAGGVPDQARILDGFRGVVESAAKATKKENSRVVFGGEFAGLLRAEGHADWGTQVEKAANGLRKTHNVDILCLYPHAFCKAGDQIYQDICQEHAAVYSR